MSTRISFKLHGQYQDMALQLESSVDREGWEIYESQQKIYQRRLAESNEEFAKWTAEGKSVVDFKSTVEVPPLPFPPMKLTKDEICRRVFIKWMENQLVNPEQVTLGDSDERTGDDQGDTPAVSNSTTVDSTALAQPEESATQAV